MKQKRDKVIRLEVHRLFHSFKDAWIKFYHNETHRYMPTGPEIR